jgi:hypothetical protein
MHESRIWHCQPVVQTQANRALARCSAKLRGHFDCADDAGVQCGQVFGGDPVFEDGLAPDLVDFVLI